MRKIVCAVLAALVAGSCAAAAAIGQPYPSIQIGMASDQVNAAVGAPTRFCDAGLQSFSLSLPAVFKGPIWECHKRVTAVQEYEVRIEFVTDQSTSRLHPIPRAGAILVLFDHPLKFKEALLDSPEVRALCAHSCHLQIVQYKSFMGSSPRPEYIRITDDAKTEVANLEFLDERGGYKAVMTADDPISQISIEPYFSLEKYSTILTTADAGTISSAGWPPQGH
jgi:hypothetical protein